MKNLQVKPSFLSQHWNTTTNQTRFESRLVRRHVSYRKEMTRDKDFKRPIQRNPMIQLRFSKQTLKLQTNFHARLGIQSSSHEHPVLGGVSSRGLETTFVELPFVFRTSPLIKPQWTDLFDKSNCHEIICRTLRKHVAWWVVSTILANLSPVLFRREADDIRFLVSKAKVEVLIWVTRARFGHSCRRW